MKEQAAGNLEEAIKLDQRVAKEFASDGPLAAKALVQARCHEKLGQNKAIKPYEPIARDFGDQRELVGYGERPAPPLPPTRTQRKIELPYPNFAEFPLLQTEGERAIYKDDATGTRGENFRGDANALYLLPVKDVESTNTPWGGAR